VIAIISPQQEALRRENLLQEIRSPVSQGSGPFRRARAPRMGRDPAPRVRAGLQHRQGQKGGPPRTYRDLLEPKWKGKLAIEGDDHEWVSSVIADMGEAAGVKFFRDLVAGNGLSVRSGHPC